MAEIDVVANWHTKQVVNWFKGLDDSLQCYIPNLEEANITGAQLLALNYEDLNNLGIEPIGHQELVLEAAQLLKNLHFNLDTENLQSRALDLSCKCRTLRSQISARRRNDIDATGALRRGLSIPVLKLACNVLDSSKLLIIWLDRPPFFSNSESRKTRGTVVRLSHELSTMVQQTVFACVIEDAVTTICTEMEALMNSLITSNDPMTIQPSSLEVAHLVNRDPSAGLGLFIKATFEGHLVITGTKEGSISSKIRRITPGDEVVAVGGQSVIGWQLSKLVAALKETPNDISITLKKCPHFLTNTNAVTPTSRRAHQEGHHRVLTVPPPISPIQKVADSRKNSVDDIMDISGGAATSDLSRSESKENLSSPKKSVVKKKKKFRKQKAKSSSNILATGAESQKKASKRNSVNSFGSSVEGSLRSASSSEAVLSVSTGNLNKNFDLRKSLEKVLRQERRDSAENLPREPKQKRLSHGHGGKSKHKKDKERQRKQSQELLPNVNDVLEELRQNKLRKTEKRSDSVSKNFESEKQLIKSEPTDVETPSSPLDLFSIPPPPEAPYTPRVENVLQVVTDEALNQSSVSSSSKSALDSPNSLLDIEHHRRFTIIGSEQMDEKWYNNLLSEVNAKRSRRGQKASARQVLERLDETTASEDSVFTSQSLLAEDSSVVKRAPKPKLRNRPMSMPPNYYSPAKLKQYRSGQISGIARSKGSLQKMDEMAPLKENSLSPVPHQVDENGVRKLAPLNCSSDDVTRSSSSNKSNSNSLENRQNKEQPSNANNNNNNRTGERTPQRNHFKTPPKPLPRLTPPVISDKVDEKPKKAEEENMPIGRSKVTGERLQIKLTPERPRSSSDEYVGILQIKPKQSSTPTSVVPQTKRTRSKTEIGADPLTPNRLAIADELNKYILRKKGGISSSSDPFSPAAMPSPTWSENDAFGPKPHSSAASSPSRSSVALMPPVAKPRSKLPSSPSSKPTSPVSSVQNRPVALMPPTGKASPLSKPPRKPSKDASPSTSSSAFPFKEKDFGRSKMAAPVSPTGKTATVSSVEGNKGDEPNRKSRSKSVDTSEYLKPTTPDKPIRRKSEGVPERSLSNISKSSPTLRGSYAAAIDGGYVLEDPDDIDGSLDRERSRKDSDGHAVKVIDGVKVRLRKSASKTNSNKKGRLKLIDQLKASPEMRSQRRISCRDLGAGECNGWLWKKKTNTNSPLSSKWSKRWVVLKDGALYCYHTEDDDKAESYLSLPGYQVTPAVESKRRFAFRVAHPLRKTFFFASDRQIDMSRWMNKMGLAAIGYKSPNNGSGNHKENQLKDEQYFSESESEDQVNVSQSGTESSTPNSSPEKVLHTLTNSQKNAKTPRHMSTQPDLNRSARFPKNKSKEILSATTQTTDSLERNTRNRSKSEAVVSVSKLQKSEDVKNENFHSSHSSSALSAQNDENSSPFTSPVKKPAVTADQRKHKAVDTSRRKQFLDSGHLSSSLEAIQPPSPGNLKPSHSEEELRHLRVIAAKKAEEVARREERSSSSSLISNPSVENLQTADTSAMFMKNKAAIGKKSSIGSPGKISKTQEANDSGSRSPLVKRRDIAGRPKLKVDPGGQNPSEADSGRERNDSSIDDLCKALHNAEVDIHGVSRRTTLRRKMTILSKDPKQNELMLRKRALQRQIKALEGELEYYSRLDEKAITSEVIHEWINQHPSLVADLGTIRRMSKRKKPPAAKAAVSEENSSQTKDSEIKLEIANTNPDTNDIEPPQTSKTSPVSIPVPAKRLSKSQSEQFHQSPLSRHQRKHSDSELSPHSASEQSGMLSPGCPKVRPRSIAVSTQDANRLKPRSKETSPSTSAPKPYLETDL